MNREPKGTLGFEVKQLPIQDVRDLIAPLNLKTECLEHQARSLIIGIDQPEWLFALDMGLGKTKLGLDLVTLARMLTGCERALVLAPPVVLRHWKRQAAQHSELSVTLVDGDAAGKRELLETARTHIVVVSINWFVRILSQGLASLKDDADGKEAAWIDACMLLFDALVIDEAHNFKNPSSKGFKGLKEFCLDIPYRYLMTGTPIGNNYTAMWALYYILDKGATFGHSYGMFIATWFDVYIVNGKFPKFTLKPAKRAEFMRRIWTKMIRWEESECNNLPEKTYTTLPVRMHKEQQRAYDLLEATERETGKDLQFEKMKVTAGIGFKQSPKLEVALALIEEVCIENKRPFILWHWLDEEGVYLEREIKKRFPKLRMVSLRGSTPDKVKKKAIDPETGDWRTGNLDLIIGNVKSIGIGVDLFEASSCAYFSNNRSIIDRKQSEKRIHRTGQLRQCQYIDIVCEDTIDEVNLKVLDIAAENFSALTGDRQ